MKSCRKHMLEVPEFLLTKALLLLFLPCPGRFYRCLWVQDRTGQADSGKLFALEWEAMSFELVSAVKSSQVNKGECI